MTGARVAAIVVFLVEVYLSHQGGKKSGEESRWLSERTGLNESFLRSSAHILLFAALACVYMLAFGLAGMVAVLIWATVDETTKPLLHNQRHCSGRDIMLNYIGCGIGGAMAALI